MLFVVSAQQKIYIQLVRDHRNKKKPKQKNTPTKLQGKISKKNDPSNKAQAHKIQNLNQAAVRNPYLYNTYKVTIFAMPGLTTGNGDGITASTMCNAIAKAASFAMRWSSKVVLM